MMAKWLKSAKLAATMDALSLKGVRAIRFDWLKITFGGLLLFTAAEMTHATPPISTDSPLGFFTNVSSRLLAQEMNINLNYIQVYPTNQYTPAVHRLLQVTANVLDATTTNIYPSVFRPLFSADGFGNVFITGYTNICPTTDPLNDSQMTPPIDAVNVSGVNMPTNVYGVPWIIGVKKGFPNFNSFTLETLFSQTRKMQLSRPNTIVNYISSPGSYTISQQFSLGITNMLEVECWNSYQAAHTNPVVIFVTDAISGVVTNDEGTMAPLFNFVAPSYTTVFNWSGRGVNPLPQVASFVQPLYVTNRAILSTSNYNFLNPIFAPFNPTAPASFFTNILMPEWGLQMTNRLRVVMLETNSADGLVHVIDYVQLAGPNSSNDAGADIRTLYDTLVHNGYDDQWDTNVVNTMPKAMANQIGVSAAFDTVIMSYWNGFPGGGAGVTNQIDGFRGFLGFSYLPGSPIQGMASNFVGQSALQMQAPYTPTALVSYTSRWEANDPLVHYLGSDLNDLSQSTGAYNYVVPLRYGQLNHRYMPWGGNPQYGINDYNPYNSALKDPLVRNSDGWFFPNNQTLNSSWLGQVHRGTPWQTIYLKSVDVPTTTVLVSVGNNLTNLPTWNFLTGDLDPVDAATMRPIEDWHVASLLASMFNTNDFRSLLSVNNPDPNAWLVTLDGLTALTNENSGQMDAIIVSSNSPQAAIIASAVETARSAQPNQFFRDAGDILSVPQLSTASPFVNLADPTNQITDAVYEVIPAQLLGLIRSDSIGSTTNSNGQTIVQFTGYDQHIYAVETSTNILNWTCIGTNSPVNGILNFPVNPPSGAHPEFYRSKLLN
jgi:hypothetical protein